jgi:hypothetical protein
MTRRYGGNGRKLKPCCHNQCAGRRIETVRAIFGNAARNFLAQFDAELVERVDAEQDGIGEGAMFVKSNQRANGRRRDVIDQDCGRWPVAGIAARTILACPARASAQRLAQSN